ncbi:hypothetical protein FNU76_00055 [Chitinimonas arctica]|uniref:Uncharacterized protein n=1 Tax=Chitinimonas arctica TaxID=2594795 RepID=A0A516S9M3_9NEIS|nr:hypothetical protein [Chitinimonas arctica]QDQ24860.1 hypothetical protein FNU76_00055 [Chitinimonas arctica]
MTTIQPHASGPISLENLPERDRSENKAINHRRAQHEDDPGRAPDGLPERKQAGRDSTGASNGAKRAAKEAVFNLMQIREALDGLASDNDTLTAIQKRSSGATMTADEQARYANFEATRQNYANNHRYYSSLRQQHPELMRLPDQPSPSDYSDRAVLARNNRGEATLAAMSSSDSPHRGDSKKYFAWGFNVG